MKVKELMYAHTDKAEAVGEREAFEASVPLCEMLQEDVVWSEEAGRYVLAGYLEMMPAVERRNADWQLWQQARAAPATGIADASVQGVNANNCDLVKEQLLEALENTATWIENLPVPTVGAAGQLVKIDKAIAAARKGEQ